MAGAKSLAVYSLDEATSYFAAGLALLDKNPTCASNDQVADFFVPYTRLLSVMVQPKTLIEVFDRYLTRIDCLGNDSRVVIVRHRLVIALVWNARYRDAAALQRETSRIADHLKESRSKAYSLAGDILVSTAIASRPLDEFEILKRDAIKAATDTTDAYIQHWTWAVIRFEELHRGRQTEALGSAPELMQVGRSLNDPRSTGLGLAYLSFLALNIGSYAEALDYGEQSLVVAVTPWDQVFATNVKGFALVLLRRTEEGLKLLDGESWLFA